MKTRFNHKILAMTIGLLPVSWSSVMGQDLDTYLSLALQNSPAIRASQMAYQATMEKIPQVRSWPEPQVNGSVFLNPMMLPMGNQIGSVSAMQMFPWRSVLDAKEETVVKLAEVFLGERKVTANDIIDQVRNAWYPLIANREKQELQRQNLNLLDDIRQLATTQFQQGLAPMSDVLRVDVMKEDILANLEILQAEQTSLERQFNILLNRKEDDLIVMPETMDPIDFPMFQDSSYDNNPVLALLDQRIAVAQAAMQQADLDRKPMIGAGLQYMPLIRRKNTNVEIPPNTGRDMIMPMFSVTVPIWNKKYDAAVTEQKLMQVQYAELKDASMLTLRKEDENLRYLMDKAVVNYQKRDNQYQKTRQILELLTTEYRNSKGDLTEILRLEQQLLDYRMEQVELKMNYYQADARRKSLRGYPDINQ